MRFRLIFAVLLIFVLAGCATGSVEDVLRAPALPSEFMEFNDELNKIKASGLELLAPSGGANRQAIQLTDLDGDGADEGVALFRETANTYKTYVYIFKKIDDRYEVRARIEGAGNAVERVSYADLLGSGDQQLIIGWTVSDSDARAVTVYALRDTAAKKLCEIACRHFIVADLDSDGVSDLGVVYDDPGDGTEKFALYGKRSESLLFRAAAPLTQSRGAILRIRAANAADGVPAIFVEHAFHETGLVTDVLVWKNNALQNITYSARTKASDMTARTSATFCEDVDFDGNLEIPAAQPAGKSRDLSEGEPLRGTLWYGFNESLQLTEEALDFRSAYDGWQLTLPLDWEGKVTAFYQHFGENETVATFYGAAETHDIPLFSIHVFYGEEREKRAAASGYARLLERSDAIFAVDFDQPSFLDYDITEDMLRERFRYREAEWSTGEVVF